MRCCWARWALAIPALLRCCWCAWQGCLADCVGAGTGLDAAGIARKQAVLEQALQANAAATTPLERLALRWWF